MKPPNSLSDSDLLHYADEHLQYEIDMLTWSAGILAFLAIYKAEGYLPWAINNGLLNSFALHARNLINFLYSRSMGRDFATDIVLEDYVDTDVINNHLPPISPDLQQTLTKANKQAAHLSMERIQYEQAGKEWMFIELASQILKAFASIAPHIPDSKISDTLREKLTRSGLRIPIVDIEIGKSPSGDPVSVTFSLRISRDGKKIEGVSA
jgi:hypothetical protein